MTETVVVGFDDTEHSFRAVDCAAREAQARGAELRLVNAYQWIPPTTFGLPPARSPTPSCTTPTARSSSSPSTDTPEH